MITKRYHFETIHSTNLKAKEFAAAGAEHGSLITADAQNAGIGRCGRSWSSEKDAGIYMSMVLRPKIATEKAAMLTLVAAVAVESAIAESFECQPMIKWPNDIVLNKKKICGILTEMTLNGTEIDYVVIGIGINANNKDFPEEIMQTASSLFLELGNKIDKDMLITKVWEKFAVYYELFLQTGDLSFIKEIYEIALINKDEKVKVLDPLGEYIGVARGITNKGELIVDTEGKTQYVSSGEVSVRGIYGYV